MNPAIPRRRHSVFEDEFETIIFGGGFVGFAAARALSRKGQSVLLVESSGTLLWEATSALENQVDSCTFHPAWMRWLEEMAVGRSDDGRFINPAIAEILTAQALASPSAPFQTLLYATPLTVELVDRHICRVTVATKGGPRALKARRWIDATENGVLGRLAQPLLRPRAPHKRFRSLVLQSVFPEQIDVVANQLTDTHPGLACLPSVRRGERHLRWEVDRTPWHRKVTALVTDLRRLLGPEDPSRTVVTHCAMQDYPIYELTSPTVSRPTLPNNLTLLSPALVSNAFLSLEDRFVFGAQVTPSTDGALADDSRRVDSFAPVETPDFPEYDVLIAGTGTAGAMAAFSAARSGARTLAIDATLFPGGIGTGGGINSYFYGATGGGQTEVDECSSRMTTLLTGVSGGLNGWHHDAKKLALLWLFEEAGVRFQGNATVIDVEADDQGGIAAIHAVVNGRIVRIGAKTFVDATGDGDLCVLAGARFSAGRESDGRMLAYSQSLFVLHEENATLTVRSCNFDAGWVDSTDPEDLSRARLTGIAQHAQADWEKKERHPFAVAPLLGLRHSRHIHTDYTVTMDDLISHKSFPDSIGEAHTVADTHSVDFEFESDELAFYYLVCKGFWNPLGCQLPYRMLLPCGLNNVWIACRAAGIQVEASYGLRMQRDMQRLGEAAGTAAALTASSGRDSRTIDMPALQAGLNIPRQQSVVPAVIGSTRAEWLDALDQGRPGVHLWHLLRDRAAKPEVAKRLSSDSSRTTFYTAALLAMWGDEDAEPRLLHALDTHEEGPAPEEHSVRGAWGQCIDYPFWLQAILLLRRCGTRRSLPALHRVAGQPGLPLNALTVIACSLEKLAGRIGADPLLMDTLDLLLAAAAQADSHLPPSRSLWNTLYERTQLKLENDCGADTRQDHSWQLHLVVARTRTLLGLALQPQARAFLQDSRGFVRRAFEPLCPATEHRRARRVPPAVRSESLQHSCAIEVTPFSS